MEKRSILHMLDPMSTNSPFDVNMAMDAGFDVLMPYSNVKLDSVNRLTQDVIFSRSPAGIKRTGMFIGGRDLGLAVDMLDACRQAMVPPFEVSVFADPSGAFTTAASLVACVEKELKTKHGKELKDCKALVFGGTGPVGIATGIIASLAGADTFLVDHLSSEAAAEVAKTYNRRFECAINGVCANTDDDKINLVATADIIFSAAKAGVQDKDCPGISMERMNLILAPDWGWYTTVTDNMKKALEFSEATLAAPEHLTVKETLTMLLEQIESAPKSSKWKGRAIIGRRKSWFEIPEEVDGTRSK